VSRGGVSAETAAKETLHVMHEVAEMSADAQRLVRSGSVEAIARER
jgi:hypothetical protein